MEYEGGEVCLFGGLLKRGELSVCVVVGFRRISSLEMDGASLQAGSSKFLVQRCWVSKAEVRKTASGRSGWSGWCCSGSK